jgi:O-Antigen ligase
VIGASMPAGRRLAGSAALGSGLLVAAGASASLAVGISLILVRHPPPPLFVVAVGVGLLGTLALALARYDAAVAIGFLLLAIVRVEPAPTDVILGAVIAVAFVTGRFALERTPPAAVVLIGIFLVINLLASVEVVDAARAAAFLSTTVYLCIFALWLASYVDSWRRARLLVRTYISAALASTLLVLCALLLPIPGQEIFITGGRGLALFKDPNVFGPFLVPAALILLEELLTPRLLRSRALVKIAMFVLLSLGVLFSYSRAAWLNLGIGVAVVLVVLGLRRGGAARALKLLVVLLLATMALAAVVAATDSAEFLQERARFQAYDVGRFSAQRLGLAAAEQYPLGIGPGQFENFVSISAHSTYVRTVAEEGFLGFVTLVLLLLFTLHWAAQNAVRGRNPYGVGSAALLGAWAGLLANSFFIDTIHWRHLWLLAGLIWAGRSTARLVSHSPDRLDRTRMERR